MGTRTSLEKYLIAGVVVLTLTAIGLLVGLIVVSTQEDAHDHGAEVCFTEGCIETANQLKKNMNLTADP